MARRLSRDAMTNFDGEDFSKISAFFLPEPKHSHIITQQINSYLLLQFSMQQELIIPLFPFHFTAHIRHGNTKY